MLSLGVFLELLVFGKRAREADDLPDALVDALVKDRFVAGDVVPRQPRLASAQCLGEAVALAHVSRVVLRADDNMIGIVGIVAVGKRVSLMKSVLLR